MKNWGLWPIYTAFSKLTLAITHLLLSLSSGPPSAKAEPWTSLLPSCLPESVATSVIFTVSVLPVFTPLSSPLPQFGTSSLDRNSIVFSYSLTFPFPVLLPVPCLISKAQIWSGVPPLPTTLLVPSYSLRHRTGRTRPSYSLPASSSSTLLYHLQFLIAFWFLSPMFSFLEGVPPPGLFFFFF